MNPRRRQRTRADDEESAEVRPSPRQSIEERMEDVLHDDDADEPIVVHSIPVRMPAFHPGLPVQATATAHNTEGRPSPAPPEAAGSRQLSRPQQPAAPSSSSPASARAGRPRRRGTHDSSSSSAGTSAAVSSVTSDCIIRKNSLRFKHKHSDSQSFYSSSSSSDGSYSSDSKESSSDGGRRSKREGDNDNGGGMEVMDLRPSSHLTGNVGDDGKPVNLSSNVIIDMETIDGLFPTATGEMHEGADPPSHWERAERPVLPSPSTGAGPSGGNPFGGSEQAQRALESLMRDRGEGHGSAFRAGRKKKRSLSLPRVRRPGGGSVGSRSSRGSSRSGSRNGLYRSRDSRGSGGSASSGSSLESYDARSYGAVSCGSSKLWDTLESKGSQHRRASYDSAVTLYSAESSQASKRRRRGSHARRCAKAMISTLALAALSLLIVYATNSEEGRDAMFNFMPKGLGQYMIPFGNNNDESPKDQRRAHGKHHGNHHGNHHGDHHGDRHDDHHGDHMLRFRKLPEGGSKVEIVARDEVDDQEVVKDSYDKANPFLVQDKIQLERLHPRNRELQEGIVYEEGERMTDAQGMIVVPQEQVRALNQGYPTVNRQEIETPMVAGIETSRLPA